MRSEAWALAVLIVLATSRAGAEPDPMLEYRERFRSGLARYQAGAIGDAVQIWEPIYRELGPERGWRLSFNLARAYSALGDVTRAAERYEAFLLQVTQRREKGESIEPLIAREEQETQAWLKETAATKGRIAIAAGATPVAVKIDGSDARIAGFSAYVAPGKHTIVFDPGSPRESRREVEVAAGQHLELTPPAIEEPKAPPPVPLTVAPPPPPPVRYEQRVERPFSPVVLYVAGGAAIASGVMPLLTGLAADDYHSSFVNRSTPAREEEYSAKQTTFWATLAIPITLGVGTAALTAWYFLGARERQVPVVIATPNGGYAVWSKSF